tara:strand:+ start:124728 stop:127181 length:2454 start_codon:yes stop_codon:yes gene_type:complete
MGYFAHHYSVAGLSDLAISGLTDLEVVDLGGVLLLQATAAETGQVLSWNIGGALPSFLGQTYLGGGSGLGMQMQLGRMSLDGQELVWVHGGSGLGLAGYAVGANGALTEVARLAQDMGAIGDFTLVETGGQTLALTYRQGGDGIDVWRQDGSGDFNLWRHTDVSQAASGWDALSMAHTQIDSQNLVVTISAADNAVRSFAVDAQNGLVARDHLSAADGLGINGPSHLELVQIGAVRYAVVGASGSASITVLRLSSDGSLTPVDQVNDDRNTRFDGLSVMQTIEVGGRVYIVAGGSDDGLSLLTMMPDGRLLHLETIASDLSVGLMNPNALSLTEVDGNILLHVAEQGTGTLSAWEIDVSDTIMRVAGNGGGLLSGGAGNDVLISGNGRDTLVGGAGEDIFVLRPDGNQRDVIQDFQLGVDRIDMSQFGRFYSLDALDFQSRWYGAEITYQGQTIEIRTAGGVPLNLDDFVPADLLDVGHVDVVQMATQPAIIGSSLSEQLYGYGGHDMLVGEGGADTLNGRSGDDTLNGGSGADHLIGGYGTDTADYTGSFGSLRVDMMYAQLNTNIAAGDTYDSIENLIGSRGFDNLRGTLGDNVIEGRGNVDYIFGRRGDDTLDGGVGDDVLFGGVGADLLIGGTHRDRAQYSESLTALVLDLNDPSRNIGEAIGDTYDSIEDLAGGRYDDHISGDGGDNRLFGREGSDQLYGRWGDDYLNGGAHADRLDGGLGNDTLRGGTHNDTFVFNGGHDVVEDFTRSHADRVALEAAALPFGAGITAAQVLSQYGSIQGGNLVLDFGAAGSVTLEGVTSLGGMADYILIF